MKYGNGLIFSFCEPVFLVPVAGNDYTKFPYGHRNETVLCSESMPDAEEQGAPNFFSNRPDSTDHTVCCNHSTCHGSMKAAINEWMWLCPNKTLS